MQRQTSKAIRKPAQDEDTWNRTSDCCFLETSRHFDLPLFKTNLSKIHHSGKQSAQIAAFPQKSAL